MASVEKRSVTLYSRNGLIVGGNHKPIAEALEKARHNCVIDGELVAFDAHGISRFQLLQNALRTTTQAARMNMAACRPERPPWSASELASARGYLRRIFSIALPLASSSMSLSR
jgi:hypothetical protein